MTARDAQRRFDRAAETFDSADFVHARTRQGLFDRLEPMTVKVRTVVDLGSATGASARKGSVSEGTSICDFDDEEKQHPGDEGRGFSQVGNPPEQEERDDPGQGQPDGGQDGGDGRRARCRDCRSAIRNQ